MGVNAWLLSLISDTLDHTLADWHNLVAHLQGTVSTLCERDSPDQVCRLFGDDISMELFAHSLASLQLAGLHANLIPVGDPGPVYFASLFAGPSGPSKFSTQINQLSFQGDQEEDEDLASAED